MVTTFSRLGIKCQSCSWSARHGKQFPPLLILYPRSRPLRIWSPLGHLSRPSRLAPAPAHSPQPGRILCLPYSFLSLSAMMAFIYCTAKTTIGSRSVPSFLYKIQYERSSTYTVKRGNWRTTTGIPTLGSYESTTRAPWLELERFVVPTDIGLHQGIVYGYHLLEPSGARSRRHRRREAKC